MPRIKQTTVYKYDELSDDAKERARDWYRESMAGDTYAAESVTEDFADVLKAAGFAVSKRRGTQSELALYWDTNPIGGGFDAYWSAQRVDVAPVIADRPVTYTDGDGKVQTCKSNARLVPILERIAKLAADHPHSYGSVNTSTRYMLLECTWDVGDETEETNPDDVEEFESICQDLAHYLGRAVSDEFDYQNSDAAVAESIEANEYEFTEEGKRA